MFENLVNQSACNLISHDIKKKVFPRTVLFSGNEDSGKLSAALEVARVFSCTAEKKGEWVCECPSCLKQKSLLANNILIMGPKDCSLEISASKETFIKAFRDNAKYLLATRYLFIRSIRKLTLRFSSILLNGDNNLNKIGTILEEINDNLELIDIPRELPDFNKTVKICDELEKLCLKIESDFLSDSIPINQVRNMEEWAHKKTEEGKKIIIIENADRMQTGVRNALLKILEEPPIDCIFILLTSRRNAVMQTILSRVRTYNFLDRNIESQQKVIKLVFHNEYFNGKIVDYLHTFLPVPSSKIMEEASAFFNTVVHSSIPDITQIVKNCGNFEPRIELKLFLIQISKEAKNIRSTSVGCEALFKLLQSTRICWENVTLYNQSVISALENLVREISKINMTYGRILCEDM